MADQMQEATPFATLRTELTVQRSHFAFVYAAAQHAGWDVEPEIEGVTTDDGYDHEIKLRVRVRVPLSALAQAPDLSDFSGDGIERLIADLKLVA